MGALFAAWLAEVGIITWRDLKPGSGHSIAGLPLPADYLATFALYGALGLVPSSNRGASRAAALVGWGFVVATFMNFQPLAKFTGGTTPAAATAQKGATP